MDKWFLCSHEEFEPAYIKVYESGGLEKNVEEALVLLEDCTVCPRNCHVNRKEKVGACLTGRYTKVSSYFPHFGEEDCLRGWNGSGTIFFSHCNLRCIFCQNYEISWLGEGNFTKPEDIAKMMIHLQNIGCHNINFVTPEHVVPQILESLPYAIDLGLRLPIVYNTSAYDSIHSMKLMEGIVDIYMPDFKLWTNEASIRYLGSRDYPDAAKQVIKEMHRQVGELRFDENGLALRGLLVRHLVMPGMLDETDKIMEFIANEISKDTYVNIMDQYCPAARVVLTEKYPEIGRRLSREEYLKALKIAQKHGLHRFDTRWLRHSSGQIAKQCQRFREISII